MKTQIINLPEVTIRYLRLEDQVQAELIAKLIEHELKSNRDYVKELEEVVNKAYKKVLSYSLSDINS